MLSDLRRRRDLVSGEALKRETLLQELALLKRRRSAQCLLGDCLRLRRIGECRCEEQVELELPDTEEAVELLDADELAEWYLDDIDFEHELLFDLDEGLFETDLLLDERSLV